jgi:hypothetical protein
MLGYDPVSARCASGRREVFGRQRWRGSSDAHLGHACWSRRRDRRHRGIGRSVAAHHQDRGRLYWIVRAGREKDADCHHRRCTEPGRSNFPHCTPSLAVLDPAQNPMPNLPSPSDRLSVQAWRGRVRTRAPITALWFAESTSQRGLAGEVQSCIDGTRRCTYRSRGRGLEPSEPAELLKR